MDEETMSKHEAKVLEAEDEILIYFHISQFVPLSDSESNNLLETVEYLTTIKQVKIKMILGSTNQDLVTTSFLRNVKPLKEKVKEVEVRFSEIVTNTFEVIDSEKVIFKIFNPIQTSEYLAMIFLWQRNFAEKMRSKFYEIWEKATSMN